LSGPVSDQDAFGVLAQCDPRCSTAEGFYVCSPPNLNFVGPECTAGTFEGQMLARVGERIEYALLRIPNFSGTGAEEVAMLHGSWVVREGRQVISLGYVYPDPRSAPALPDTAMDRHR
jgi:hypothetical protein